MYPILPNRSYTHAAIISEKVYLSTSRTILESIIYAISKNDVLSENIRFQTYLKTLPRKSSFWGWSSPTFFESQVKNKLPTIKEFNLGNFRQADYVGVVEGNIFYTTLSLQKPNNQGTKNKAVELVGTASFNKPIIWGPFAIKNHNTQDLEWIVQDEEFNLHLMDLKGNKLWKKQLDGNILGPVKQLDLYRNNRLQIAFTTEKSFQILDRNGKSLKGFVKKGMRNSSTFSAFDYDKQRDYRLLLSSGNSLNMYDRRMLEVKGWKKTKLINALRYPPKHIRIGNRDYIALVGKYGKGELLHRTGKTRIKIPDDIKFTQDIYPNKNGFVSIDDKNRLIQISTTGEINKTVLPFETRYSLVANKNTLVTLNENKVTINDKLIELDFGVYAPPQIQLVNNRTYILIWDNQSGKVYVFDSDAMPIDNFPVIGKRWAMIGQGIAGTSVFLATQNNTKELRFYLIP
jgi:hypothetical protein